MERSGPVVRFDAVGLAYPAPGGGLGAEVLRGVSLALDDGSFTWLLGPSGAGKTSLLRLMHAALRPTRGTVDVLGVGTGAAPRRALPALRRRIGVVHQDLRLLPHLSIFDNVALPLRLARRPESVIAEDAAEILRWIGLDHRAHARPAELSGGEQQRAAIARAVICRPTLLLADEPTGNVDASQARRLLALFAEMNRLGTTIVIATHSEDLVQRFPAPAMRLERGRIRDHDEG